MPAMLRPRGKATKIAQKILGISKTKKRKPLSGKPLSGKPLSDK